MGLRRYDASGNPVALAPGAQPYGVGTQALMRPDGSIVFPSGADDATQTLEVRAIKADATPDTSFSGDGVASVSFTGLRPGGLSGSSSPRAAWMGMQPDGKLIVAGTAAAGGLDLARFLPDGHVDTSYADAGRLTLFKHEVQARDLAFSRYGGLDPSGAPVAFIQASDIWTSVRGAVRIPGTTKTTALHATANRTSGPRGSVVTITGGGCPSGFAALSTKDDFGTGVAERAPWANSTRVETDLNGNFTATLTMASERQAATATSGSSTFEPDAHVPDPGVLPRHRYVGHFGELHLHRAAHCVGDRDAPPPRAR